MHERIKSMWASIIKILLVDGYSQKALADKVGVNQSTICRLGDGDGPEPRWSVGDALIELAGGRASLAERGVDVAARARSSKAPNGVDRRDPNRPSPYAGTDIDRRPPAPTGEG